MKEKFATALDTGKKKGIAIVLATGLVLSFGTLTAFGASNWESLQESVLVTTDDDGTKYSTDGGQTWSSEVPDGTEVSVGENGEEIVITGTPPEGAMDDVHDAINAASEIVSATENDGNIDVKMEDDGNILYSTDGGQTWSENAPEGVTVDTE